MDTLETETLTLPADIKMKIKCLPKQHWHQCFSEKYKVLWCPSNGASVLMFSQFPGCYSCVYQPDMTTEMDTIGSWVWPGWQSEPPGCEASPGRSACHPAASPAPPRSARSGCRWLSLLLPSGLRLRLLCCAGAPCFQSRGWETWSLETATSATLTQSDRRVPQTQTGLTFPSPDRRAAGSIGVEPLPRWHCSSILSIFSSVRDDLWRSLLVLLLCRS